jgi:hypothetical protein
MSKEFEQIVNKNIEKWSRLNRWLATERLGKKFIREVKVAQKRLKQGKGRIYTYDEFKKKFLSG